MSNRIYFQCQILVKEISIIFLKFHRNMSRKIPSMVHEPNLSVCYIFKVNSIDFFESQPSKFADFISSLKSRNFRVCRKLFLQVCSHFVVLNLTCRHVDSSINNVTKIFFAIFLNRTIFPILTYTYARSGSHSHTLAR